MNINIINLIKITFFYDINYIIKNRNKLRKKCYAQQMNSVFSNIQFFSEHY
jgi:hypothetical protein